MIRKISQSYRNALSRSNKRLRQKLRVINGPTVRGPRKKKIKNDDSTSTPGTAETVEEGHSGTENLRFQTGELGKNPEKISQ